MSSTVNDTILTSNLGSSLRVTLDVDKAISNRWFLNQVHLAEFEWNECQIGMDIVVCPKFDLPTIRPKFVRSIDESKSRNVASTNLTINETHRKLNYAGEEARKAKLITMSHPAWTRYEILSFQSHPKRFNLVAKLHNEREILLRTPWYFLQFLIRVWLKSNLP